MIGRYMVERRNLVSGTTFIMMVITTLTLLFILISVGPLVFF
jgi:hypothetical protein